MNILIDSSDSEIDSRAYFSVENRIMFIYSELAIINNSLPNESKIIEFQDIFLKNQSVIDEREEH